MRNLPVKYLFLICPASSNHLSSPTFFILQRYAGITVTGKTSTGECVLDLTAFIEETVKAVEKKEEEKNR
jgi:hypothetical protein